MDDDESLNDERDPFDPLLLVVLDGAIAGIDGSNAGEAVIPDVSTGRELRFVGAALLPS
jgi:hypothetical protein